MVPFRPPARRPAVTSPVWTLLGEGAEMGVLSPTLQSGQVFGNLRVMGGGSLL